MRRIDPFHPVHGESIAALFRSRLHSEENLFHPSRRKRQKHQKRSPDKAICRIVSRSVCLSVSHSLPLRLVFVLFISLSSSCVSLCRGNATDLSRAASDSYVSEITRHVVLRIP